MMSVDRPGLMIMAESLVCS